MMNTNTDMSTGIPSPPLRMIAPNGAPIKKNMRHDRASVSLPTASILCCRMSRSPSDVIMLLKLRSLRRDCTFMLICERAIRFCSSVRREKAESTSYFVVAASFNARSESRCDTLGRVKNMARSLA